MYTPASTTSPPWRSRFGRRGIRIRCGNGRSRDSCYCCSILDKYFIISWRQIVVFFRSFNLKSSIPKYRLVNCSCYCNWSRRYQSCKFSLFLLSWAELGRLKIWLSWAELSWPDFKFRWAERSWAGPSQIFSELSWFFWAQNYVCFIKRADFIKSQ